MNPVGNAPKKSSTRKDAVMSKKKTVSNGMKTYSAKPTDVTRSWFVIDAAELPLGRMATHAAKLLTGKHKPMYTAHIDCGDYVIVINADKLKVTGGKELKKTYYRHSGYPGGITETKLRDMDPIDVVTKAIRGMIPANKLRDERLKRLKVYTGSEHNHEAQKPQTITLKDMK